MTVNIIVLANTQNIFKQLLALRRMPAIGALVNGDNKLLRNGNLITWTDGVIVGAALAAKYAAKAAPTNIQMHKLFYFHSLGPLITLSKLAELAFMSKSF